MTTSWDDGNPADLRIAEILLSKGLRGTFYIPIRFGDRQVLTGRDLRTLVSQGHEVGAHTLSHRDLPGLPTSEIQKEVGTCKVILEEDLGESVNMFCYPRGRYNNNVLQCVKEAGYRGARTVGMFVTAPRFDPFQMPTSLQAYPHSKVTYIKNLAKRCEIGALSDYLLCYSRHGSWVEIGRALFDCVLSGGGIWHLYGHSWKIDKLNLWGELQDLLEYVANRPGVRYLTNSQTIGFAGK